MGCPFRISTPRKQPALHAMTWEKVVAEAARRHDAAAKCCPSGRGRVGALWRPHIEQALDRQALASPDPGHTAGPSSEPHRVRQRRSRSAGSRDRPRATAAGGRREPRVRQHRRRAAHLAVAARAVPRRRRARSAASPSAIRQRSRHPFLPRAAGRLAGGPRRGPSARHPRRPDLPAQLSRRTPTTTSASGCCATSSAT